jgi:Gp157 protein
MSATQELHREVEAAKALLAALAPLDLENDGALHRDMVEGSTDLHEAIRGAVARIVELRALKSGVATTMQILAERRDRFDDQEGRIRAALLTAMEVGRLQSLETTLATVSRRAVAPSAVVIAESEIPDHFKIPQPPKLDKRALLAALKEGPVAGAELSNGGMTIAVRLT